MKSKHWIVLAASITRARWHRDLMVNVSCGHRYDHVSDVTEQRWLTLTFYEKIDSYICDQICILSFTLFSMLHAIFYVNANRLNYTKKFNSLQKWLKNDAHHFNSKKIITLKMISLKLHRYSQMDNNNFFWRIHIWYLSKLFNYSFIIIYCWDNEFLKIKIALYKYNAQAMIYNIQCY